MDDGWMIMVDAWMDRWRKGGTGGRMNGLMNEKMIECWVCG